MTISRMPEMKLHAVQPAASNARSSGYAHEVQVNVMVRVGLQAFLTNERTAQLC